MTHKLIIPDPNDPAKHAENIAQAAGTNALIIGPISMTDPDDVTKHWAYRGHPEDFTPPTKNPDDCICGGSKPGATGRLLIANCPCCDGIQLLRWEECPCDNPSHFRTTLPPKTSMRLRYIDKVEGIS